MKRLFLVAAVSLCASLFLATCVYAEVPHMIRFQGKVTDKAGNPLTGAYDIRFRIYGVETGGTFLWSETQPDIPVNNGIFTVLLGNVTYLDLAFDAPYWLSMEVNDDGEMSPRQALGTVGYAIHAETAERFIEQSVIPQGAIILWMGTSCPEGWDRVTTIDGKFLVSGSSYNPTAGGSNTHDHEGVTGSHALTIAEMPAHDHAETAVRDTGVGPRGWIYEHETDGSTVIGTRSHASQGGGGGHNHTISNADNRPEFARVILCQKD